MFGYSQLIWLDVGLSKTMTIDDAENSALKARSDNKLVIRMKDSASTIFDVVINNHNDEVQLVPFIKVSNSTFTCCSPNGLHVFLQTLDKGILRHIVITAGPEDIYFTLPDSKTIQYLAVSPIWYYLVTFERPDKPINDTTVPNVKIWDSPNGEVFHEKFYKSFAKSFWPYIRWSNNEKCCFILSSAAAKEIQIYHQVQFQSRIQKIKGLTEDPIVSFSTAPSFELDKNAVVFHTFSPGTKGQPSKFAVLRYPDHLGQSPIVVKSFFRAKELTVKWNPKGGASNNSSIQVPLVKVGPVSSVEWYSDSTVLGKRRQPSLPLVVKCQN